MSVGSVNNFTKHAVWKIMAKVHEIKGYLKDW
jgi:hypothetical protein